MKLQRVCGLGVIKHIMPLIIGSNQYYVLLTCSYICCCAMLLLGRVSARDKWFSSRPTLPIKAAFSSQYVWLFGAGPGLDTASIAIWARFIRAQEHCSTYGDHFMNYGHRNICLKINALRAQTYSCRSAEFDSWYKQTCFFTWSLHAGRQFQNVCESKQTAGLFWTSLTWCFTHPHIWSLLKIHMAKYDTYGMLLRVAQFWNHCSSALIVCNCFINKSFRSNVSSLQLFSSRLQTWE